MCNTRGIGFFFKTLQALQKLVEHKRLDEFEIMTKRRFLKNLVLQHHFIHTVEFGWIVTREANQTHDLN